MRTVPCHPRPRLCHLYSAGRPAPRPAGNRPDLDRAASRGRCRQGRRPPAQQRVHESLRNRRALRGHHRSHEKERRQRQLLARRSLFPGTPGRQRPAPRSALEPADPKRRLRIHRARGRIHLHQLSRARRGGPGGREAEGRTRISGEDRRHRREDRHRRDQDRGDESAGRAVCRQRRGPRGPVRLCDRRAVQARLHFHLRRDQRERPQQTALERRLLDLGLFADRRVDQSRQQRRTALRHRRESGRHEHAHQRIEPRPRLRDPEQPDERDRPSAHRREQDPAALARHPH